eukprot:SAG11_NODE_12317_length_709_cov_1.183607_1_plen_61_part_01
MYIHIHVVLLVVDVVVPVPVVGPRPVFRQLSRFGSPDPIMAILILVPMAMLVDLVCRVWLI